MFRTRWLPLAALVGTLVFISHAIAVEAESPHAHVPLVNLPGGPVVQTEMDELGNLFKQKDFFESSAMSMAHPWAPCNVLAAGITGVYLNTFWWQIERNGRTTPPPRGTNILGQFDEKLTEGNIPRKNPGETAEILARLVIWRSSGISIQANTLLSEWTQKTCLDALLKTGPEYVGKQMDKLINKQTFSHLSPLTRWSVAISRNDTEKDLVELRSAGFLNTKPHSGGNPLAPCSLLTAKRLGSNLNELWGDILQGRVELPPVANPFLLKEFQDDLKFGTIPTDDPAKAAEIVARLFASRIVMTNIVSEMFTSPSTQEQCLDEIFAPGSIRKRLTQEGKLPSP